MRSARAGSVEGAKRTASMPPETTWKVVSAPRARKKSIARRPIVITTSNPATARRSRRSTTASGVSIRVNSRFWPHTPPSSTSVGPPPQK